MSQSHMRSIMAGFQIICLEFFIVTKNEYKNIIEGPFSLNTELHYV